MDIIDNNLVLVNEIIALNIFFYFILVQLNDISKAQEFIVEKENDERKIFALYTHAHTHTFDC